MIPDSRQTIHVGIHYVVAPTPVLDIERHLEFQQVLISRGVSFTNASFANGESLITRDAPSQLQVKVAPLPGSPVGQLLLLAPGAWPGLSAVIKDFDAVLDAFGQIWPKEQRQILSVDAAVRDLYETSSEHAFKELWETRLGQPQSSLMELGGPILGGGLRFVVPQVVDNVMLYTRDVKIESLLVDSRKIFVETQFTWAQPQPLGADFLPGEKLNAINDYIENQIIAFIAGEPNDHNS